MWALISPAKQLLIIVTLTVLIILGLQGLQEWWTGTSPPLYKAISTVVFLLGTVIVAIANSIWRWVWARVPVLNRVFFPDLNGMWKGTLKSSWVDDDGNAKGPISSEIIIRQSLFAISVKQKTGESRSYSTRVIAEADPNADRYKLWYSYSNTPLSEVQARSAPHDGVAWLEINLLEDPSLLVGQYYSARGTRGDLEVRRAG